MSYLSRTILSDLSVGGLYGESAPVWRYLMRREHEFHKNMETQRREILDWARPVILAHRAIFLFIPPLTRAQTIASLVAAISRASTSFVNRAKAFFDPSGL